MHVALIDRGLLRLPTQPGTHRARTPPSAGDGMVRPEAPSPRTVRVLAVTGPPGGLSENAAGPRLL